MKAAVTDFWNQFLLTQADRKLPATCNAWAFGNTPEMMDELSELVLKGSKRATTSLAWIYEHFPNEKRPEVGDLSVILNSSGNPVCIIENISVTKRTFGRAPSVDMEVICEIFKLVYPGESQCVSS
jgi:uncharacterized protein YhfF